MEKHNFVGKLGGGNALSKLATAKFVAKAGKQLCCGLDPTGPNLQGENPERRKNNLIPVKCSD